MKSRGIHLQMLGVELGVEVLLSPNPPTFSNEIFDAWAETERVIVQGYNPKSQICYYIGLHELGHIAHGHCDDREMWYEVNKIEGEAEAWNWALDNSQEEISLDTSQFILSKYALGSYVKENVEEVGYPGVNYDSVKERLRPNYVVTNVQRSIGTLFNSQKTTGKCNSS